MGRTSISPRSITGKWPSAIYLLSDPKCELSLGSETYDGGGLDGDWALPYCSSGPWLEGHWPDPRPSRNGLGGITLSEKCCAICSVFQNKRIQIWMAIEYRHNFLEVDLWIWLWIKPQFQEKGCTMLWTRCRNEKNVFLCKLKIVDQGSEILYTSHLLTNWTTLQKKQVLLLTK